MPLSRRHAPFRTGAHVVVLAVLGGAAYPRPLHIQGSPLRRNRNDGFATAGYPGLFSLGHADAVVIDSTIQP